MCDGDCAEPEADSLDLDLEDEAQDPCDDAVQPADTPDAMESIVSVVREDDPVVCEAATKAGVPLLCFIASYASTRVSPIEAVHPSIGLYDEFAIEVAINAIKANCNGADRVYMLVNSPGGSMAASYKVARALRKSFSHITSFVPHVAASGGTMIALAGNEIVMGLMSNLSPLDPQVSYQGTVVSANVFVRALARACKWFEKKQPEEAPYPYKALTDKLDLLVLEDFANTASLCEEYIEDILCMGGTEAGLAETVASELVWNHRIHAEVLHSDRLKELGLPIRDADDEQFREIWKVMRNWLAKYMMREVPVTIIKYAVPG